MSVKRRAEPPPALYYTK